MYLLHWHPRIFLCILLIYY